MKYFETHFDEYIIESLNHNLHPKLEILFDQFPKKINQLSNLIAYFLECYWAIEHASIAQFYEIPHE